MPLANLQLFWNSLEPIDSLLANRTLDWQTRCPVILLPCLTRYLSFAFQVVPLLLLRQRGRVSDEHGRHHSQPVSAVHNDGRGIVYAKSYVDRCLPRTQKFVTRVPRLKPSHLFTCLSLRWGKSVFPVGRPRPGTSIDRPRPADRLSLMRLCTASW